MKRIFFILLLLSATATMNSCGSSQSAYQQALEAIAPELNWSKLPFPLDRSENVDINTKIKLTFSKPIDPYSVMGSENLFRFQVINQSGYAIEGNITVENNNSTIVFNPTIGGQPASLDPLTKYFVTTLIPGVAGTVSWTFRTKDFSGNATGKFKVLSIEPNWPSNQVPLIFKRTPIVVNFSEPISPNTETCDSPILKNAMQVINVEPANAANRFSIGGWPGTICLTCIASGYCNQLVFYPTRDYINGGAIGSLLFIQLRRVDGFRGLSGEPLNVSSMEAQKVVIFGLYDALQYWWGQ